MQLRSLATLVLTLLFLLAAPSWLLAQTPPTHDLCANAIPIGLGSVSGSNLNANAEGTSLCDADLGPDVWYRYEGPIDENGIAIDSLGSNFDAVVSIHARCPESSRGRDAQYVPHYTSYEIDGSLACSSEALEDQAAVLVPSVLPSGFLIRVAGSNPTAQGEFRLHVDQGVTVSGRVVDRTTGEPVTRGEVLVMSPSFVEYEPLVFRNPSHWTAPLDANGHFQVRGVSPGQLQLSVRGIDPFINQVYPDKPCLRQSYEQCFPNGGETLLARAGETVEDLVFEVDRGGILRGRVLDQVTGEPVAHAVVEGRYLYPRPRPSTVSKADGTYELSGLLEPSIVLTASAPTHRAAVYPDFACAHDGCENSSFEDAPVVVVERNQIFEGVDFALETRSGLSGQILDAADRTPVTDAVVEVYADYQLLRQAPVDAQGKYRIGGLDPSPQAYRVLVRSRTHRSELLGGHPCVYPRNPFCDPNASNPLYLREDDFTNNLNFQLDRFPTLSGRVTDEQTGTPLPGVSVTFSGTTWTGTSLTDEEGRYRLEGAVPGTLLARTENASPYTNELFGGFPCQSNPCDLLSSDLVEVDFGQDVTGIDFQLSLGGTVTGTVRDAETLQPIPFVQVAFSNADSLAFQSQATTDRDGRYTVILPAGSTRAAAMGVYLGQDRGYFGEVYGGISCHSYCSIQDLETGTPIPVDGGGTLSGIDFQLDRPSGISGFVRTEDGAPIASVPLKLLTPSGSYRASTETDQRGFYTFTQVVPGSYKVVAGDSAFQGRPGIIWPDTLCPNDPATPCDFESGGTPITVDGGGQFTRGIDFMGLQTSAITGTVTDEGTGLPLAGVGIDIWRATQGFHWIAGQTVTDADGQYHIAVDPGQYSISTDNGPLGGISEIYDNIRCDAGSVRLGTCDLDDSNAVSFGFAGPAVVDFALTVGQTCVADERTLCLGEAGRFRVQVNWQIDAANPASAVGLTRDSGYFWFFDADNVEMVVKVLDACTLESNRFWVFAGGLTDVATSLIVTDTWTGAVQTYATQAGQPFPPILDTSAFNTCSAAPIGSGLVHEPPHFEPKALFCDAELCLNDERFEIDALWNAPDGTQGVATGIALTDDSGYFWFFNDDNIELVVKVLDGCSEPQNTYWVFAAGLTDVEVTLRVTDRNTGEMREYINPQGTPFQPILDTQAFATCP